MKPSTKHLTLLVQSSSVALVSDSARKVRLDPCSLVFRKAKPSLLTTTTCCKLNKTPNAPSRCCFYEKRNP